MGSQQPPQYYTDITTSAQREQYAARDLRGFDNPGFRRGLAVLIVSFVCFISAFLINVITGTGGGELAIFKPTATLENAFDSVALMEEIRPTATPYPTYTPGPDIRATEAVIIATQNAIDEEIAQLNIQLTKMENEKADQLHILQVEKAVAEKDEARASADEAILDAKKYESEVNSIVAKSDADLAAHVSMLETSTAQDIQATATVQALGIQKQETNHLISSVFFGVLGLLGLGAVFGLLSFLYRKLNDGYQTDQEINQKRVDEYEQAIRDLESLSIEEQRKADQKEIKDFMEACIKVSGRDTDIVPSRSVLEWGGGQWQRYKKIMDAYHLTVFQDNKTRLRVGTLGELYDECDNDRFPHPTKKADERMLHHVTRTRMRENTKERAGTHENAPGAYLSA